MKAYPHQLAALAYCLQHKRAVVQMPAGAGKSYVLRRLAARLLSDTPVYVACPSVQIAHQLRLELLKEGLRPVLDRASNVASAHARLVLGTMQTMMHRTSKYQREGALLVDECHHINYGAPEYRSFAQHFDTLIGFSATPWSERCMEFFDNRRFVYSLSESIRNVTNANFLLRSWSDPVVGTFQIVFTSSCKEARLLAATLPLSCYAVHDYKHAHSQIERFRSGNIGTIFVYRMLGEGFDVPKCKRLWIARETDSEIAAMQMLGRALRPSGNSIAEIWVKSNKTYRTILSAIKMSG